MNLTPSVNLNWLNGQTRELSPLIRSEMRENKNVERYEKSVVGGNVSLYLFLFFVFSLFLIL